VDATQKHHLPVQFSEDHTRLFIKRETVRSPTGLALRQLWSYVVVLITAAYTCNLRAVLIRRDPPPPLATLKNFMASGRPLILSSMDEFGHEALQSSIIEVDRWIHASAKEVWFWTDLNFNQYVDRLEEVENSIGSDEYYQFHHGLFRRLMDGKDPVRIMAEESYTGFSFVGHAIKKYHPWRNEITMAVMLNQDVGFVAGDRWAEYEG